MFNLFRSRDKAVRFLLTGLLCLVALSMVTYLIPGSGSGYGSDTADKTVVAKIGKDELTSLDVSRQVQAATRSQQLPPALLSIYVPQIVKQMIDERAMAYEADRLGLKVTPEETDSAIIDTLPPQLIKDGKVDGATLNAMLQQQGITLGELKSSTARQLLISKLGQIVAQGVVVSPAEIEKEFRHRNDKVKIEYALLAPAKYQSQAEPSGAGMKAYYDAHKAEFRVAEKKSFGIIILDPQKIGADIHPADAQLQAEYNNRRSEFQTPERVKARHILLKADASNDAQVKPKAEALLKQIQGGADFAKLARENSQDTGSAAQGGELPGWITKGQMVPEFEKATFSLPVGATSGLVKTTYGYHIIQVEAHEQPRLQPFEEVKNQLLADYQKRQANQQMQALADKAIAELRKDPLHPEKAAETAGATAIRAENIQAGDPIPGVGTAKEFDDATAALRKGEVTPGPVVPANQNGKAIIASVTDVQPAHPASFEEAGIEIRNKASQEKLNQLLDSKANELVARVKSMDGDLQKAAKSLGIEVKTSPDVDRNCAIESVGTASSVPDLFAKPAGSIVGPTTLSAGHLVAKIVSRTPANLADLAVQTASIRDELRQQKVRERAQFFEEGLRDRLKADGKLKVNQDVINRIVQSYGQRS
jgi:peptidyl-prolyl cis-trans isomerase D